MIMKLILDLALRLLIHKHHRFIVHRPILLFNSRRITYLFHKHDYSEGAFFSSDAVQTRISSCIILLYTLFYYCKALRIVICSFIRIYDMIWVLHYTGRSILQSTYVSVLCACSKMWCNLVDRLAHVLLHFIVLFSLIWAGLYPLRVVAHPHRKS